MKAILFAIFGIVVVLGLFIFQFRLLRKRNPNMELLIALWKKVNATKRD